MTKHYDYMTVGAKETDREEMRYEISKDMPASRSYFRLEYDAFSEAEVPMDSVRELQPILITE